jgi:uncharacterized RDD family membrane protein YckC
MMTEEALSKKRYYDQKHYDLEQGLYQAIPGWGRIIISVFFDVSLCTMIPLFIFFTFFASDDFNFKNQIFLAILIITSFGLNFYFSMKKKGSTIGMFLFGIMLVRETNFMHVTEEDVLDLLFCRFATDIVYSDFYESVSHYTSSKKQTIAMKRMKIIYVSKKAYKTFMVKNEKDIKELTEYAYNIYMQ